MSKKIKNTDDLKAILDTYQEEYQEKIFSIVNKVFDEHLKERCDKYGFEFFSGNGEFLFKHIESGKTYDLDEIPSCLRVPQNIKDIFKMYMEPYGFRADNVGSLCSNYKGNQNATK